MIFIVLYYSSIMKKYKIDTGMLVITVILFALLLYILWCKVLSKIVKPVLLEGNTDETETSDDTETSDETAEEDVPVESEFKSNIMDIVAGTDNNSGTSGINYFYEKGLLYNFGQFSINKDLNGKQLFPKLNNNRFGKMKILDGDNESMKKGKEKINKEGGSGFAEYWKNSLNFLGPGNNEDGKPLDVDGYILGCVKQAVTNNMDYITVDASGCYGYNYINESLYNNNTLEDSNYVNDNKDNKRIPKRSQKDKNGNDIILENTILIKTDDFLNNFMNEIKGPDEKGEYKSIKCDIFNVSNKWTCVPKNTTETHNITDTITNRYGTDSTPGSFQLFNSTLKGIWENITLGNLFLSLMGGYEGDSTSLDTPNDISNVTHSWMNDSNVYQDNTQATQLDSNNTTSSYISGGSNLVTTPQASLIQGVNSTNGFALLGEKTVRKELSGKVNPSMVDKDDLIKLGMTVNTIKTSRIAIENGRHENGDLMTEVELKRYTRSLNANLVFKAQLLRIIETKSKSKASMNSKNKVRMIPFKPNDPLYIPFSSNNTTITTGDNFAGLQ